MEEGEEGGRRGGGGGSDGGGGRERKLGWYNRAGKGHGKDFTLVSGMIFSAWNEEEYKGIEKGMLN